MTADISISRQIKEVLAKYLKREPESILPEHHLREDLGMDSLMTFELLYDLEKTFDLEIPNEDLPGLQTIADVVTYLEARISPEALRDTGNPSPPPQPSAPHSSPSKSSKPLSRATSGGAGKTGTKPASKAKPRASGKVAPSKPATIKTAPTRKTTSKAKRK